MSVSRGPVLAVVVALIVGGAIGALAFSGHGSSSPHPAGPSTDALTGASAFSPTRYGPLGLSIAQPRGWQVTERSGVIRMLSPDQMASVAVSAPRPAREEVTLRRSDKEELLKLFKPAQVLGHRDGTIAGQRVLTTELVGVTPKHRRIRMLSTAVSSAYRTYSIQVFSVESPAALRLSQVRSVLNSLQFFAPSG